MHASTSVKKISYCENQLKFTVLKSTLKLTVFTSQENTHLSFSILFSAISQHHRTTSPAERGAMGQGTGSSIPAG